MSRARSGTSALIAALAIAVAVGCSSGGGGGGGGAVVAPIDGAYVVTFTEQGGTCPGIMPGSTETGPWTFVVVADDPVNGNVHIAMSDDVNWAGSYDASTGVLTFSGTVEVAGELHELHRGSGTIRFAPTDDAAQLSFTGSVTIVDSTNSCTVTGSLSGTMLQPGPSSPGVLPLLVRSWVEEGVPTSAGFIQMDRFDPSCDPGGLDDSFLFEASRSGTYRFRADYSSGTLALSLRDGTGSVPGPELACAVSGSPGWELTLDLVAGERVIVIGDMLGAQFQWTLTVDRIGGGLIPLGPNAQGYEEFALGLDPTVILVEIPGGTFDMGQAGVDTDTVPVHEVTLSPYLVSKYEITNAQYRLFCDTTSTPYPPAPDCCDVPADHFTDPAYDDHPVVNVSYDALTAPGGYLEWAGLALPTEAQWEFAARGTSGASYPWGPELPSQGAPPYRANYCPIASCDADGYLATAPVQVGGVSPFAASASPFGVMEMAGNVAEWCRDWYGTYDAAPAVDPLGPTSGPGRVMRGGAHPFDAWSTLAALRSWSSDTEFGLEWVGFRPVMAAP